jgi:hypothetical protein
MKEGYRLQILYWSVFAALRYNFFAVGKKDFRCNPPSLQLLFFNLALKPQTIVYGIKI